MGTHGSALVDRSPNKHILNVCNMRTLTYKNQSHMEAVTPIPDPELWFEILLARQKTEADFNINTHQ